MTITAGRTRTQVRRAMMRKVPLMLIAVGAVLAAALPLASPASGTTAAGGSHVGGVAGSPAGQAGIAWKRCKGMGRRFQCARVAVPLNWHHPAGPQIKLAVIRYLGSDQRHRIGSMFVNPGGPGGTSGVDFLKQAGPVLSTWGRGRFNVVSWDPRGNGTSDPVRCFTSQAAQARFWRGVQIPVTPAQSRAYVPKVRALARRCGRVSGPLLDNISTEDTARDLNRLRQLVGDRTLTYIGLSYGTMIGQTYANLFPRRVRAMLLDGIVDPVEYTASAERRAVNQAEFADEVFRQFVRLCQQAGRSGCALAGHSESVARRVARLFARVRRAPIPAPHANPPGVLDYSDLLLSTFTPLRIPGDWPQFARDLNAAASGDGSALETAARLMRSPAGFDGATVSSAISCLDGPASKPVSAWPGVMGHLTRVARLWGPYVGWTLWAPCAANWPGHATERYAGPWNAKTKTPILLLSNRYDPASGYANAKAAQRLLGNAVLLTENGFGHLTLNDPSKCVQKWRIRYLVHLVTPPRGTVCDANHPPFP